MPEPATAFVCPGQGPHSPEMLQPFLKDDYFRQTYPLICELTGTDILAALESEGSNFIRRNEIASLLTVYVTTLVAERVQQKGTEFQFTSGYSVGQWAAMHLAGMITFEELIRIVWERANIMNTVQSSNPGAMLAVIGLSVEAATDACNQASNGDDQVVISNYNAPGQLTLAGTVSAISEAENLLKPISRKVSRVDVSGAWHCWLLDDTTAPFNEFMQSISLAEPKVPVADNVSGEILPSDEESLRKQLGDQLASPVKWQQSIRTLVAAGAERFVEIGHGNMLTKFGFFIDRKVKHITYDQLEQS